MPCRRPSLLVLIGLSCVMGIAPAVAAVPMELETLVPEDPLLVVYTPSLGEIERDIVGLMERFGAEDEGGSIFELFEGISPELGELELIADRRRPFAVVLRLVPGFPAPMFSMIVPLLDGLTPDDVEERLGVVPLGASDGYVALGTDTSYRAGGRRQPMLAGIGDDDLTARLDVEGLFVALGPMVDMIVQMAMQQPDADGNPPMANPEGMQAALDMVAVLRDGIGAIELAANVDDARLDLAAAARFRADGPLALGAQPTLDDVWADAALLPADAPMLMAAGIDLTNLEPLVDAIVGISKAVTGGEDGPYAALSRLQQQSVELWMNGLRPYVASFDMGADGTSMRWLESSMAPAKDLADLRAMMDAMDGMGIETSWEETRRVEGFDVMTSTIDVDFAAMAALDPDSPELGDDELATLDALFDQFLTPMALAAGDQKLVMTMDADPEAIDAFLAEIASSSRGDVPARLEQARGWAGDDAQGVMVTDVKAWFEIFARVAEIGDTEGSAEIAAQLDQLPATPVYGAARVDGDWLRGRLSMETDVLVALVQAIQTLEASE